MACFIGQGCLQCLPVRPAEQHISPGGSGKACKDEVGEHGQIQETKDVLGCKTARGKQGPGVGTAVL